MRSPIETFPISLTRLGGSQGELGLRAPSLRPALNMTVKRRFIARGEILHHAGATFSDLYEVDVGCFKTCLTIPSGISQVTGFKIAGDLLGLDAIGSGMHTTDATALEDSHVWVISFAVLTELCAASFETQHAFNKFLSLDATANRAMMLMLGSQTADARLAGFLVNLLARLNSCGFSGTSLVLRMSRREIGSYLGLTVESVSRAFTRLALDGVLRVRTRGIEVLRSDLLRQRAKLQPALHIQ